MISLIPSRHIRQRASRKEVSMYAIIGRYKVSMQETGLIIRHGAGIAFDLTLGETLGLLDFMRAYQQTLISMRNEDPETQPIIRIILEEREGLNEGP